MIGNCQTIQEQCESEAAHESLITFVSPGDLSLKLLYMNRLGVCFWKRLQYNFSSLNDHLYDSKLWFVSQLRDISVHFIHSLPRCFVGKEGRCWEFWHGFDLSLVHSTPLGFTSISKATYAETVSLISLFHRSFTSLPNSTFVDQKSVNQKLPPFACGLWNGLR